MNNVGTCSNNLVPSPEPAGPTKFGETSQIINLSYSWGGSLMFGLRIPDATAAGEISELRFFKLRLSENYNFFPDGDQFWSLTRAKFGSSLKNSQATFDGNSGGFFVATRQSIGFYRVG